MPKEVLLIFQSLSGNADPADPSHVVSPDVDFDEHFGGSPDLNWITGTESTIAGWSGESLNSLAVGFTVGAPLSDNLNLAVGYAATVNDNDSGDLEIDGFRVSLVYNWQRLFRGIKKLEERRLLDKLGRQKR